MREFHEIRFWMILVGMLAYILRISMIFWRP